VELTVRKGVSISRKKGIQGNWKGEIPYFCCPKREIFLFTLPMAIGMVKVEKQIPP
jgi:hypothetical protein